VKALLDSDEFVDEAPRTVYAKLLDQGTYLCSPSTMYRILREHDEVRERRRQATHPAHKKPELIATRPNEVWSWDITKLHGPEKWTYFYLYVIWDIWSRYVVGWMLARAERAELARMLIAESIERQGVRRDQLTLHSDRGSPMSAKPVARLLADLGVTKSRSRPHVSNDNPYSESQFRTFKYRPDFPDRFGSYEDGRAHCGRFFRWYNEDHRHSGIGLHTPADVHHGRAEAISGQRPAASGQRPAASGVSSYSTPTPSIPSASSADRPHRRPFRRWRGSTNRRRRPPTHQISEKSVSERLTPTAFTAMVGTGGTCHDAFASRAQAHKSSRARDLPPKPIVGYR
jgi:putative transposase